MFKDAIQMALSYKKNSNDFMDEVMRELEVCVCLNNTLFMMIQFTDFIHVVLQNFDLESKEETSDKEEETQEGKPDSA